MNIKKNSLKNQVLGSANGMEEIIEKHFENMVDEILSISDTYDSALTELKKISVIRIHNPGSIIKSLEIAIKRKACQQKTLNEHLQEKSGAKIKSNVKLKRCGQTWLKMPMIKSRLTGTSRDV